MNNPNTQAQAVAATELQKPATTVAIFDAKALGELGLQDADLPAIHEVAARIDPSQPLSVAEFGRAVAEHTSRYADELLEQVKNKDLDDAGQKLSQVVVIARGLNMNALSDRRSKIPLIGPLIDRVKLSAGNFMGQFESTKDQIDQLVSEVELTQDGLRKRNGTLEQMFAAVKEEHHLLGIHIAAGQLRLDELRTQADGSRGTALTPTQVQEQADLDSVIANLDIRVGNLRTMQQSALQTLPQIRVVQTSNQVLVDKFHTIKEITVPAWKRQFMLALGLNEQRNAVQLANTIDDTTNDLLRRNAELLHRNSVETAKANQRLVIDMDTLQQVQTTLIRTVEDVIKIQKDGVVQRRKAEEQIQAMRTNLQLTLSRPDAREAA